MKAKILTLVCAAVLTGWLPLRAETARDISGWERAASAYNAGEWQTALEEYEALQEAGYGGAALDYNIGNCYYKLGGYLGRAILHYERALKQDPGMEDAAFNLAMAREQAVDRIDSVPDFVLALWWERLREQGSPDGWAVLAVVLFVTTLAALLVFRYGSSPGLRKTAFALAVVSILFAIFAAGLAFDARRARLREDAAIVLAPVSAVRSSPGASGNSLFILHEGTRVEVLETLGEWYRIELADGRQGWLRQREVEII